ncbi:MAG: hypothetical protein JO244_11530 [Solirubrobacterales bacterium]|nr:hypothetical protein [Solirubrobacterales bacterium]
MVIGLAGAVGAASAAAAPSSPPSHASLQDFVCVRAADPLDRVITVTGVMRSVRGTHRLKMRFVLERRTAGATSFSTVPGGDLGHWLSPKPASLGQRPSDVWRLKKFVANLPGPAVYRFRVSFHWLSGRTSLLDHQTLVSPQCDAAG